MQPSHSYLDPVSPRSDYSNPFSHKSPTLATSRQRSAIDLLSQIQTMQQNGGGLTRSTSVSNIMRRKLPVLNSGYPFSLVRKSLDNASSGESSGSLARDYETRRQKMLRDLEVKLQRQRSSEELMKKHLIKLKKQEENVKYIQEEQQYKFQKQQEKRNIHANRYQQLLTEQDQKSREIIDRWRQEDEEDRRTKWDKVWNNYGRNSVSQSTSRSKDRLQQVKQSIDHLVSHRMNVLEHKMRKSEDTYRSQLYLKLRQSHELNQRLNEKIADARDYKSHQEYDKAVKHHQLQRKYLEKLQQRMRDQQYNSEVIQHKRKEQHERFSRNIKGEREQSKEKLQDLLAKFQKAEELRKQQAEKQEDRSKIKREIGKLKEMDKQELQARLKRIADTKKLMILMKERESQEKINQIREKQEREMRMRKEFDMKVALDKLTIKSQFMSQGITGAQSQMSRQQLPQIMSKQNTLIDLQNL